MRQARLNLSLFILFLVSLTPLSAMAQSSLELYAVDTSQVETTFTDSGGKSAAVSLHFTARNADLTPMSLEAEALKVMIGDKEVPVFAKRLLTLEKSEEAVAVVAVFPIAKDYLEEFFGIRLNAAIFVERMRDKDWAGIVAYDSEAHETAPVSGQGDLSWLADQISELKNSEIIEPNLFIGATAGLEMAGAIKDVKEKYLVVITNAEGAVVGDDRAAIKAIDAFKTRARELGVRPMMIGYTPDGPEELKYADWLKKMSAADGTYSEATSLDDLPGVVSKVFSQIYGQYVLEVEVDLSGDFWLENGAHPFTLSTKVGSREVKSTQRESWPALAK